MTYDNRLRSLKIRQAACDSQLESYDRLPIRPRRQEFSTTLMGVTSLENYCRHWGRQLWSSVRGVFVPEVSQSKGLRNVMPQQSQSPKPASRVRTSGRWCRRNPPHSDRHGRLLMHQTPRTERHTFHVRGTTMSTGSRKSKSVITTLATKLGAAPAVLLRQNLPNLCK